MQTGMILVVGSALIHAFSPKINVSALVPEYRWVSFAGDISIGYVFLEIFPELSHAQEELEHSAIPFIAYLENHIYLLALLDLHLNHSNLLVIGSGFSFHNINAFFLQKLTNQRQRMNLLNIGC